MGGFSSRYSGEIFSGHHNIVFGDREAIGGISCGGVRCADSNQGGLLYNDWAGAVAGLLVCEPARPSRFLVHVALDIHVQH